MRWRKLGLVYVPDGQEKSAASHAANPVPVHLGDDLYRVFISTRDAANRSSVNFVDVAISDIPRVTNVGVKPLLEPGRPGCFDDSGISIGSIVSAGEKWYLYYLGWNLGVVAPWRNSIGIAVGDPHAPLFSRFCEGPLLDRTPTDPYSLSYPCVVRIGERWHMWYGSAQRFSSRVPDMRFVIKHASSDDGIIWHRDEKVALSLIGADVAMARPWVMVENGLFHIWFSRRDRSGKDFRIGYACSKDGISWERQEAGIDVSADGWDSEMICYPCVFDHAGRRYMLYNGNGYGRTGFGLAVME
jgi:hypothetical protein